MRTIVLKNPQVTEDTWNGQSIAASGSYTIQSESERDSFATDSKVNQDIWSSPAKLVINDGENDLSPVEADRWLKGISEQRTATGVLKAALVEADGNFKSRVSHDWANKHTWYNDSVLVTGETLTQVPLTNSYTFANDLVYLQGGRIMDEDDLYPSYELTIYDNGVEVDPADYTVDAENNKITFDSAPTGPVTADYYKEAGSTFVLKPASGQVLALRKAEIQCAENTQMKPITFEVWAYNPADLPNKVCVDKRLYKNERDIISIGNLGQGYIPKFGNLAQNVLVFPFDYPRAIFLYDSMGMELRIKIVDDTEFGGEWSSITFYTVEEDEPS